MRMPNAFECLYTSKPGVKTKSSTRSVNVFVRLGSDYDQNYYEYEIR